MTIRAAPLHGDAPGTTGGALFRVRRAERVLRGAALTSSALRATAGVLVVPLLAAFVDASVALPASVRRLVPIAALVAGAMILGKRLRRSGALGQSIVSAALWIESRFPTLRYALVTAVDPSLSGTVPELERRSAEVRFEPLVMRAARGALRAPALAALACAAALFALPSGVVARVVRPRAGDALERLLPRTTANALETIVVRVTPPAYANLPRQSFDDPASVRALVGSEVVVEGRVARSGVAARVGEGTIRATVVGGRWSVAMAVPAGALAVRLTSGPNERLLVLDPVVDSAPAVIITLPARDSISRRAAGTVRLVADLADDLGLATGAFEYIVSSGGGETFTFRSGRVGSTSFAARTGLLVATLSLDSLDVRPGDIVHVRAVALDRNTVTGPGAGASETRTLRIARASEYDSLAVEGAPPGEPEQNALSQRMLLLLTEALERNRTSHARPALVRESRNLAVDQTRLRKRVGELVFTRIGEAGAEEGDALEKRLDRRVNADSLLAAADRATSVLAGASLERNADETPLVAINRPLLEAYNHMWNAGTELELGEPGKAVPWMQKALDALQTARAAERIYLRGRARAVVVDIERVRLSGRERGAPTARTARNSADPARLARLARFDAVLAFARTAPGAAADSLLLLRLDLVDRDATAGRALEAAANALRRAGNATLALARARRALAGDAPRRGALSSWSAPW